MTVVERTPTERVAYLQGYLAGLTAMERYPGNILLQQKWVLEQLELERLKAELESGS